MPRPSPSRNLSATAPSIERLEPRRLFSGGAPNGPYVLTAAPSAAAVQLSFYDSADNESNFIIERSTAGGSFTPIATLDPQAGIHGQILYTDSAVAAGVTYAYRAYAINGIYQSSIVGPVSITTPGAPTEPARVIPYSVPDGPYALAVNANPSASFDVTFYDSATNEAGFVVERSTGPDGPFTALATLAPSPGRSALITYTDATANASTTYYYRVYAFNGIYQSSINGPVSPSSIRLADLGNSTLTVGGGTLQTNYDSTVISGSTEFDGIITSNSTYISTIGMQDLSNITHAINLNGYTGGVITGQTILNIGALNLGSYGQVVNGGTLQIHPIDPQTINTSNLTLNSGLINNSSTMLLGSSGQTTTIQNGTLSLNNGAILSNNGTFTLGSFSSTATNSVSISPGLGSLVSNNYTIADGVTLILQTVPPGPFTIQNTSDTASFVQWNGTAYTVAPQTSLLLNGLTKMGSGTLNFVNNSTFTLTPPTDPGSGSL